MQYHKLTPAERQTKHWRERRNRIICKLLGSNTSMTPEEAARKANGIMREKKNTKWASKKKRAKKRKFVPNISQDELGGWHIEVLSYHRLGATGAWPLVCSIAACMGNWPKVKRKKVDELREQMESIRAWYEHAHQADIVNNQHLDAIAGR